MMSEKTEQNILIHNIYYMLAYIYKTLEHPNYRNAGTEEFENVHDMMAFLLGKAVSRQLKQGLYREYVSKEEELTSLRGKIDMQASIRNRIDQKQRLICEYDELSENNLYNQIIKTTMHHLIYMNTVRPENKALLKKNMLFFDSVDQIALKGIHWNRISYHRNNRSYEMILTLCRMVLQGLLFTDEEGEIRLQSFFKEDVMSWLYENFILEYYRRHHPEFHAYPDCVKWNLDDESADFLPQMKTDITLKYHGKILIIDAKYYSHSLQDNRGHLSIHSGNLYQMYAYVKNMDKDQTGSVSGMILYAKTQEQIQPNSRFSISGNCIYVRTLDLTIPFDGVRDQLEEIAEMLGEE